MSNVLFQNYRRHYQAGAEKAFASASDIKRFHLDRLPRWIDGLNRDARVLDAGCATGYQLGLLADFGFENLVGVDISKQLVEIAQSSLADKATIVLAELSDFLANTPDDSFDVILFHHVIEHIQRPEVVPLLSELRRVLRKNGRLSIRTPNANCLGAGPHLFGDHTHVTWFNDRSLLQALEAAEFCAEKVHFLQKSPQLFFSLRHPVRCLSRLLNRARWHLQNIVHRMIFFMCDVKSMTHCYNSEIETLAIKS